MDRGFSLVELMMAVFVMAFAIMTSLTTLQSSYSAIDTARCTTLAAQIIQSTLENLRLKNWTTINALGASQSIDISTIYGSALPASKNFTCTLKAIDVSGQPNLKQLVVEVAWTGLDGRAHLRDSMTYYAKDGLYDYFYTAH
ncbi:MAG: hypothetical protein A3G75_04030 [Verrucomicrobia bacterium RIFCSPLOWO2_12_FULL_64_8]|nr:MAG: hypothetical protein A3G75_04030 [Verrucomicrobia bacterium RIFCSPLOWO2_12_FULL_64_8]